MGPIKHLSVGAKPKPVVRNKLPGVVTTQKVIIACKAKGKSQKCSSEPFEAFLLQANTNIKTLQDIVEKNNTDLILCWENAKNIISQYDRMNKDLDKQLRSTKKQLVVLEDKASKKSKQLEDTSRDLKREKELTKTLERNSKGLETETDHKMKKVEGERDRKIKQLESDRDKWKEKAEKLTSELLVLKSSSLDKKPSAIDQLILKQEEMNMKHNMKIKSDLHIMEMKKIEDERKMSAKTQRMSYFTGGSGAKWSPSILEGRVCIM